MEELYIKSPDGKTPGEKALISQAISDKYHLEKGSLSPFTRSRIVGKNGEYPKETETESDPKNNGSTQKPEDDIVETENITFTTSEIIDIAHGEDSSEH